MWTRTNTTVRPLLRHCSRVPLQVRSCMDRHTVRWSTGRLGVATTRTAGVPVYLSSSAAAGIAAIRGTGAGTKLRHPRLQFGRQRRDDFNLRAAGWFLEADSVRVQEIAAEGRSAFDPRRRAV